MHQVFSSGSVEKNCFNRKGTDSIEKNFENTEESYQTRKEFDEKDGVCLKKSWIKNHGFCSKGVVQY